MSIEDFKKIEDRILKSAEFEKELEEWINGIDILHFDKKGNYKINGEK